MELPESSAREFIMDSGDPCWDHLLTLSNRLAKANSEWHRLPVSWYWQLMYWVSRLIEMVGYPRRANIPAEAILNFGCGVHLTGAVNSDLFAVHRYVKRRARPDLYLSGASAPRALRNRFAGIVCEHVLEHMLPGQARVVLGNLYEMLRPGGLIQISVPGLSRFVAVSGDIDILAINDIAYNYGHRFLYDEKSLIALIRDTGFREVQANSYSASPCKDHLLAEREPQSIYVIGRKPMTVGDGATPGPVSSISVRTGCV